MRNLIYRFLLLITLVIVASGFSRAQEQDIDNLLTSEYERAINLRVENRHEEAIQTFQLIIDIAKRYDCSSEILADLFMRLGDCNIVLGEVANAEKNYLEALRYTNDIDSTDAPIIRRLYHSLANMYCKTYNFDKAMFYNDKAKILYEENLDFGDGYIACLSDMAVIRSSQGFYTMAKMLIDVAMRQALSNFNNREGLDEKSYITFRVLPYISMLSSASRIYQNLGYYSDAVKLLKKSIAIAEENKLTKPHPYNNLGLLYMSKSKYERALDWLLKSYELCRTSHETLEVGMNTALVLFLSKNPGASKFCAEYSEKMRSNIQGMFAFMSGAERAIYWKHFEQYLLWMNLIIHEIGDLNYYGTIYDNILEAKGLLLRSSNAIRDAILTSGNESDIADFTQIKQLKQQILNEKDEETRAAKEKEIEAIDKRLTLHVNAYADLTSSKNIHWENVRNALSQDEVAIEFYNIPLVYGLDSVQTINCEARYCALVLRKGYKYPHIIPLCKEREFIALDKEIIYETDEIYNFIWHPLEEELKGVKNIYFAADRDLHKIGIEYAPLPEGGIMGDRYNIFRLSSTRVLAENKNKSKKESAVLYGGLKYDLEKDELIAESRSGNYHPNEASRAFTDENLRYGVKYLPGTLKEVEEISQSFSRKPQLITDMTGTEESFKSLAGVVIDIIHLATHGFFWSEEDAQKRSYVTFLNPLNRAAQSAEDNALMRSGLFFSGANIGLKGEALPDDVEDGVLTALELSNMNLGHVDMVVMSACESGLGETSGEGVFGLQRGFKLAGANTLLMSLWKVDDTATQKLMTEFYKHYLSGNSKQESLHLAQESLRKSSEYSDPQYWAAFILLDGLN